NVDDLYQSLKDRVEVVEGLHNTFYGMREFIIRDLNRFWITFGQDVSASSVTYLNRPRNENIRSLTPLYLRGGSISGRIVNGCGSFRTTAVSFVFNNLAGISGH